MLRFFSIRLATVALLTGGLFSAYVGVRDAIACPFCQAPALTLTEQICESDVVLLAEWVDATKPEADGSVKAATRFEVKAVVKGDFQPKQILQLAGYQPGDPNQLFLMTGYKAELIEWDLPLEITQAAFDYVKAAPDPDQPTAERLEYFVKYLEHADDLVATDAYGEFANAPFDDIAKVSSKLPKDKLSTWVIDPKTDAARLGLYGLLTGLAGDDEDRRVLEEFITQPSDDIRLGLNGIISGYLLLSGDEGLELLVKTKLKPEFILDESGEVKLDESGMPVPVPFSETYGAMQAVGFMWQYGGDRIAPEKLKAAMRVVLDRPDIADFAIVDLARWKDWSIQDRLFNLYGSDGFEVPGMKRAIIKYFLASTRDLPEGVSLDDAEKLPEHVTKGQKILKKLEQQDPVVVKDVRDREFVLYN
ncbi:hypothetical protein [Stratiformator vulcanicus]|uniref:Uncharacterized protein n=1 Tax=Stratiformator vulcanicus TaxID=2527980 RepID=A0A517QZS9_9PLAN|nr:hypothetical protein [Stratiformator vulcanicus]QDT37103.1 hypothetical protein Pan189_14710 [Stratiformator vulcanicus]